MRNKKRHPILGTILLIAGVCMVVNALSSPVSNGVVDTSVKVDSNSTESTQSTNSDTYSVYNIGDTVKSDNIELTLSKAEVWTGYNQYLPPSEGKEIYRVYMEVKNIGKSDLWVSSPDCYADDISCDQYYFADDSFSWDSISTGRKSVGWVYYEVPKDAESVELEYQTSYWFDKYVIFKLK